MYKVHETKFSIALPRNAIRPGSRAMVGSEVCIYRNLLNLTSLCQSYLKIDSMAMAPDYRRLNEVLIRCVNDKCFMDWL